MTQAAAPAINSPARSRLAGHLRLVTGAAITFMFVAVALLALVWTPENPNRLRILQKLQAPLTGGLLGTDHLGRDVLSMLMAGAFNSLSISALSVIVGMSIVLFAMPAFSTSPMTVARTSRSTCR